MAAYSSLANVLSKGLSVAVLYVSVPLTLPYLGTERFGLWMTLASLIGLLGFLDFGISSSLLNQIAHAAANAPAKRLRRLITHGLLFLTGVGVLLGLVLCVLISLSPLEAVFPIGHEHTNELYASAYMLSALIGLSVPMVGLQRVFLGLQRAFFCHFATSVGSITSIALLPLLAQMHAPIEQLLLATYGVQIGATLPLVLLLVYRKLIGTFNLDEFKADSRHLLRQGFHFFMLSVGVAVAWESDNIILLNTAGAAQVAIFSVAVRLFQLVTQPLAIANTPLWSAYADAAAQQRHNFLRRTLFGALALTALSAAVGAGILVVLHREILHLWIGSAIALPEALVYALAVWSVFQAAGNSFAMYLNGVGVVRPQVAVVIAFCIIAIPLKLYSAHEMGAVGLVLATLVSYVLTVVVPYLTVFRRSWFARLWNPRGG